MLQNPAGLNALTEKVIGAAIAVHREFGAGLLESIYERCLVLELELQGVRLETERGVPLTYRGIEIGSFRLDLVVEDILIVEVKRSRRWPRFTAPK
jgi:GxxExxY protein